MNNLLIVFIFGNRYGNWRLALRQYDGTAGVCANSRREPGGEV
jgi:hypothetical protein